MLAVGLVVLASPRVASAQLVQCTVSATAVSFGAINPLASGSVDTTGTVSVTCDLLDVGSVLVAYDISLSPGLSGNVSGREMSGAGGSLDYNLYRDAARTQVWGAAAASQGVSDGYLLTIGSETRDYTVYGRVALPQDAVEPGAYSDSITVQVDF